MEIDLLPDIEKCKNVSTCDVSSLERRTISSGEMSEKSRRYSVENDLSRQFHNKKVIKHALRQQAKRRRKNTTIASGNLATVPRIIVKPIPPPFEEVCPSTQKTPTMREVLASIPGFSIKPRRRSTKKLSTAAQLEQTKEGCIDLETPDSILVNTNLRGLLNKYTFATLPTLYQHKLIQLLPTVDRQILSNSPDSTIRLSSSGLNNEFFARACLDWQERLAEGEFTPENQQKLKSEADKERSRLDPWKLKHFEPIWGDKNVTGTNCIISTVRNRPPIKTTIKLRQTSSNSNKQKSTSMLKRVRTVGAVTRSCTNYKEEYLNKSESKKSLKVDSKSYQIFINSETKNVFKESPVDDIRNSNEETITNPKIKIDVDTCTSKRRRSHSTESEQRFSKRKTPSPVSCNTETSNEYTNFNNEKSDISVKVENKDVCDCTEQKEIRDDHNDNDVKSEISEQLITSNVQNIIVEKCLETYDDTNMTNDVEFSLITSNGIDSTQISNNNERIKFNNYDIPIDFPTETLIETKEKLEAEEATSEDVESLELPSHCHNIQSVDNDTHETFQILPNSLILQEESISLSKNCHENCESSECIEETAEKLEASVEESDLVFQPLSEDNFENVSNIPDEDDPTEDRFIDAENYVLEESGQISVSSLKSDENREENIQATLFGTSTSREECCWNVDSSTEKLMEVPLHALDNVPAGIIGIENTTEHVEVIPMQEELEVRLEEGTFPVSSDDWSYNVKVDADIVDEALSNSDNKSNMTENITQNQPFPKYSGNQVKLELEVTLTPEINSDNLITSTIHGTANETSSTITPAVTKTITTVIPPTTIVCLPSVVSTAAILNNQVTQVNTIPRSGLIQSSSALPYLALSTSQPIRAVPAHSKAKTKGSQTNSNRNRSSNKPPPGAVNLERSYQICQAVIQNSPNRDQLKCQLKPPPSLLAATATSSTKKTENIRQTQYGSVTSSRNYNKTFTPPLPASGSYQIISGGNGVKTVKARTIPYQQQRQPSPPVVVRHVFTSGQIPVTMAVLPQASQALSPEVVEGQNQMGHIGQYILVQRASVGDHQNIPRSSSAPPSQQQIGAINTGGASHLVSIGSKGRPASVDLDNPTLQKHRSNDFIIQCPNPGTQAITKRRLPPGVVYGDVSVENQLQNYTIISENVLLDHPGASMPAQMFLQQKTGLNISNESCHCSLKAMIICKKCGAFCHDDCVGPNKLCRTCIIR